MERFDSNFLKFFDDVKTILPDKSSDNELNCKEINIPENKEERLYFFVENWYPHMEAVSSANMEYFKDINPKLFPDLDFKKLMELANDKNQNKVWEYLHTLFVLSASTQEVKDKYGETDKIKETIEKFPQLVANMVSWKRDKVTENVKQDTKDIPELDEKFLENSSLTKLAKEISKEIDPNDFKDLESMDNPANLFQNLLNGDESSGIGKLLKTVTDKLKNKMETGEINQDDIFRDANVLLQNIAKGDNKTDDNKTPMPNLGNFMNMAQNLASMGDMMSAMGLGGNNTQNMGRKYNKKLKKKIKKKQEKLEKEKEKKKDSKYKKKNKNKYDKKKINKVKTDNKETS
jgi:hypothetical protein